MPAVVSDASVLICLGLAGQIHLLRDLYEEVSVPEAVWREVEAIALASEIPGSLLLIDESDGRK